MNPSHSKRNEYDTETNKVKNFRIRAYKFSTNAGQKSHGHHETNIIEVDQMEGYSSDFSYKEGIAKDPHIGHEAPNEFNRDYG
ncbi:hypothetical protein N9922_05500 [Cyclobacteriaceae bacterium]|nr:hypothetical protein [Cyclobacteriaceae bacterium]MDB4291648.1 hypothetical protein [Cyclobacteriaceae bacterium]MDC1369107.1 hypothetical protein [Cyclobacteriaceae bacterium]MDC6484124.1 hypothetical protein [Cyclobacteriaceae bacterium]